MVSQYLIFYVNHQRIYDKVKFINNKKIHWFSKYLSINKMYMSETVYKF